MSLRAKLSWVTLLVVLAGGVFYLRSLAKHIFLEMPLHSEESAETRLHEAALQPGIGPEVIAVLYFPSLSERKLVAESRPIKWAESDEDRVRQVLLALAEGSHHSMGHPLSASTVVRAVFLDSAGTAYIDFSKDSLTGFNPGIESECLSVYSIVDSITANMPTIKRVRMLVQGQEVETLGGHTDLTQAILPDPSLIRTGP
jgi:hypothetical protein